MPTILKADSIEDGQLDSLTPEQLDTLSTKGELEIPDPVTIPAKEPDPATATLGPDGKPIAAPAAPPEKKPAAPQLGPDGKPITAPVTTTTEPKLYAGKLKGEEALQKGIDEVAKALNLPKYVTDQLKKFADEKNYVELEKAYQALEAEQIERAKVAAAAKPPEQLATTASDRNVDPRVEFDAVLKSLDSNQRAELANEIIEDIKNDPFMLDLADYGYQYPLTEEKLKELKAENPLMVREYWKVIETKTRENLAFVKEFREIETSIEPATKTARDNAKKLIDSLGLNLSPEQVESYIKEALDSKSPVVFEDRDGIFIPRPDGIADYFKLQNFAKHVEQVKLNAATEARRSYDAEMEALRKKAVNSIGTTGLPGRKSETGNVELDPNKDSDIDQLDTVEKLEEYQRSLAKK